MNPVVIIPVRLASQRLPRKAIVDIAGKPMINWVVEAALKADIGPVIVAGCSDEIGDCVEQIDSVSFFKTDPDLKSGTDRVYAALEQFDSNSKHDVVVNLQGDLPNVNPQVLRDIVSPFHIDNIDIATPVCFIENEAEIDSPNVVKVAMDVDLESGQSGRALYFSRNRIPANAQQYYHHIGIYAFKRKALEAFVRLPSSPLEKLEKLEQLRALEAGMNVRGVVVDDKPISVDVPQDLEAAINKMKE